MVIITYIYKGEMHLSYKDWEIKRIEMVLARLGATYWELGIEDKKLK